MVPFPNYFGLVLLVATTVPADAQTCEPCARNATGGVEEPGHGGSVAFNCDLAAIKSQSLDNGTAACRDHQLMMWQRDCCPDPPKDHCSLCDTYNREKIVPPFEHQQFGSPSINFTCANVADRITYLDRDGLSSEVKKNISGFNHISQSILTVTLFRSNFSTGTATTPNGGGQELGASVKESYQIAPFDVPMAQISPTRASRIHCLGKPVLGGCLKQLLCPLQNATISKRVYFSQRFHFAVT